jgi:HEPN domain-containing protein
MNRTKDWLQYSQELCDIADLLSNNKKFAWACFTYQQASVAALKAILSDMDESTYGENLIALLRKIKKKKDNVPDNIQDATHDLNGYFKSCRDLESISEGTPCEKISQSEAKEAKSKSLAILRYAHHESH